jgi:hypothetical protein
MRSSSVDHDDNFMGGGNSRPAENYTSRDAYSSGKTYESGNGRKGS